MEEKDRVPTSLDWFFWTESDETSINHEVVMSAANFLKAIAPDFMGSKEEIEKFKDIYTGIESSLDNSKKTDEFDKEDILQQFNCIVFGYLLTDFKDKFDKEFFTYKPGKNWAGFEKFKLDGLYWKAWNNEKVSEEDLKNIPLWAENCKEFVTKNSES